MELPISNFPLGDHSRGKMFLRNFRKTFRNEEESIL
jgi:hypothetical protein